MNNFMQNLWRVVRCMNLIQFYQCVKGFYLKRLLIGPLLFIIYINDLPNCLENTTPRMFADDTNLTAVGETLGEAEKRAGVDLENV